MQRKELLHLILALAAVFLITYSPHLHYSYPLHADEWKHIIEAKKIQQATFTYSENKWEFFFDMFLYAMSKLFDLIKIYQFLPALSWTIAAFLLYLIMKSSFSHEGALLTVLFFATIKTNINILGPKFFTPSQCSIITLFLFFLLYKKAFAKDVIALVNSILLMILTFLIYPPSGILLCFFFLATFHLLPLPALKKTIIPLSLFLVVVLMLFITTISGDWHFFTEYLFFEKGWGISEVTFNPLFLYGLIPTLFAIIGMMVAWKEKKYPFLLLPLYPLLMVLIYPLLGFTLLVPYQRALIYLCIFLTPLSALGVWWYLKKIPKNAPSLYWCSLFLIIAITVFHALSNTGPYKILPLIQDDPKLIDTINQFPPTIMIASLQEALPLMALTHHHLVATSYYYTDPLDKEKIKMFFQSDCQTKEKIRKELYATLIYSKEEIPCNLHLLYQKQGEFLYQGS